MNFFSSKMNDLRNELNQLIHLSNAYPPRNLNNKNTTANNECDNEECKNEEQGTLDGNNTDRNNNDTNNNSHRASNFLNEPTISHPTLQQQETQVFSSPAVRRDISDVHMTTAIAVGDDGDRCRNHPLLNNNNSTTDHTFLPEWDNFYKDFPHFTRSTGASDASTKMNTTAVVPASSVIATSDPPAATKPEHITFLQEMDALHNELILLLGPSTFSPCLIDNKNTTMTAYRPHNCSN